MTTCFLYFFTSFYFLLVSGVDHDALVRLAEKHFSGLPQNVPNAQELSPCRYTGSEVHLWRPCNLVTLHLL